MDNRICNRKCLLDKVTPEPVGTDSLEAVFQLSDHSIACHDRRWEREQETPAMDEDCLFCKISHGQMGTDFLYENQNLVVFRDINPHAPVHLLIVPKRHIRSVNDLTATDNDILADMITTARQMANQEKVDISGYKLLFNVEKGGGQVIFHLHLHLMGGWDK
jgi:histidine triad (HIT) family protein